MLNINGLLLNNFRVFSDLTGFRLAPITILTGTNSSGKSSIIKSLSLLRNLSTGTVPYRIRLDSKDNLLGSFDQIKNNTKNDPQVTIGYAVKNLFLNEEIHISFHIEKDGDFDAIVKSITVDDGKVVLMHFENEKDKTITQINYKDFLIKLKAIKQSYLRYKEIQKGIDNIEFGEDRSPGNLDIKIIDSDTMKGIRMNYLEKENIPIEEFDRLYYLFGNQVPFPDDITPESQLIYKFSKVISEYSENQILFNSELLKRILLEPMNTLNEYSLKAIIEKEFPDLLDNITQEGGIDYLNQIINDLKMQAYDEMEHHTLEKQMSLKLQNHYMNQDEEIFQLIQNHINATFYSNPFYSAIIGASKEIWAGNLRYQKFPPNLEKLASFISLVYLKLFNEVKTDIEKLLFIPLQNFNPGLIIDFNHPLHDLIKNYTNKKIRNPFLIKWIKEFNLCDDIFIDTPINGLGYSLKTIKNGKEVVINNEGTGLNHLMTMLLAIANANEPGYRYNVNDEPVTYPRTIIFEEPEANLHPAWQSKLADMFVDAKNNLGQHFIIETHSEYIIRKLQYLVAKKLIDKNDIIIYYVDNPDEKKRDPGSPQLFKIKIDESGSLSKEFGRGFMDEADNLAIDLFNLTRINKN